MNNDDWKNRDLTGVVVWGLDFQLLWPLDMDNFESYLMDYKFTLTIIVKFI